MPHQEQQSGYEQDPLLQYEAKNRGAPQHTHKNRRFPTDGAQTLQCAIYELL